MKSTDRVVSDEVFRECLNCTEENVRLQMEVEQLRRELAKYEAQPIVAWQTPYKDTENGRVEFCEDTNCKQRGLSYHRERIEDCGLDWIGESVGLIAKPTTTANLDALLEEARKAALNEAALVVCHEFGEDGIAEALNNLAELPAPKKEREGMMNKIITLVVTRCGNCPNYDNDYYSYNETCTELDRRTDSDSIPEDCPLKDA